jgi:RNA polymerase-binding transcription factor DksA
MTDDADIASDLQQAEIAAALARHRAKAAPQGRRHCTNCEAAISELRRQAGARLCVPCQIDAERALRGQPPRGNR